ncbi:MAG TPA: hypothetical protein PLV92_27060, partial [Pirellulaceae bacterium]|nr:hypothetical protein [Pirellulaceae bacterium]
MRSVITLVIALALSAHHGCFGFFGGSAAAADDPQAGPIQRFVDHVAAQKPPAGLYSIDATAVRAADRRNLPIGVFDSGIGGLTVLEAILRIDEHDNESHQPGADGRPDFAGERF